MCCIFFTLGGHDHHLILASNRDEYLHRPTSSAAFHSFPSPSSFASTSSSAGSSATSPQLSSTPSGTHPILSGIDADLSGGGTWLGIHALSGRWAALTNFTEPAPPALPPKGKPHVLRYRSRGGLVKEWLTAEEQEEGAAQDMQSYVDRIERERDEYAGFNLLVGQLPTVKGDKRAQLAYATNRNHSQGREAEAGAEETDKLPGEVRFLLHDHDEHGSHMLEGSQTACLSCEVPPTSENGNSDSSSVSHLQPSSLQAAPASSNGLTTSTSTEATSLGLSNSVLSEPWSKVKTGRAGFDEVVQRYASSAAAASSSRSGSNTRAGAAREAEPEAEAEEAFIDSLFQVLATPSLDQVQERADLRRTVLVPAFSMAPPKGKGLRGGAGTGAGAGEGDAGSENESDKAWYGTRTSTVLLVRKSGEVTFVERDVHTLGGSRSEARLLSEEERRRGQRRYDFTLGAL